MARHLSFEKENPFEFLGSATAASPIFRLSFFLESLIRANQVYTYREKFFKELEPIRKLTESDYLMCYYVEDANEFTFFHTSAGIGESCKIPKGPRGHIVSVVAYTKTPIIVHNVDKIKEEHPGVDIDNPCHSCIRSVLCVPIVDVNEECIIVIVLYKLGESSYSKMMLQYVTEVCSWAGITYERTIQSFKTKNDFKLITKMTKYVSDYVSGDENFYTCLNRLMGLASGLSLSKICFFYDFFEKDSFTAIVYQGFVPGAHVCMEKVRTIKFKKNSIVRNVMTTKKLFNGRLESTDPRIDPEIRHLVGCEIVSLLSVPIVVDEEITSVVEFMNTSRPQGQFTSQDEKDITLISNFLSSIIYYKRGCQKLSQESARMEFYEEILSYQLKKRTLQLDLGLIDIPTIPEGFHDFTWFPSAESDVLSLLYYIFMDSCNDFFTYDSSIFSHNPLKEFIRSTKILHRDNPYHNILQSFNTVHFMYCLLKMVPLDFQPFEKAGLLLASYIHGTDHRSTDNYSMKIMGDPLTKIFAENYKVHHRLELGNFLISQFRILDHITEEEKQKVLKVFTDALINNLKYFQQQRDKFIRKLEKDFDINVPQNREMILILLFWCAIHSRHCKSFHVVKRLCDNLFLESYQLGDLERKVGLIPLPRKDKKFLHNIPDLEVMHLEKEILPCYKALKNLFPSTTPIYDLIGEICKAFKDLIELRGKKLWKPDESIGLSLEETIKI